MAKKKGKTAKRQMSKRTAQAAAGRLPRRKLKQPPLPGTGQIRDVVLDRICEALAEIREARNEGIQNETGLKQNALKRMHARNGHLYRHAGIELFRKEGAETLQVRVTKATGTVEDSPAEEPDTDVDDAAQEAEDEAQAEDETGDETVQ
jgi:hypothetical protein